MFHFFKHYFRKNKNKFSYNHPSLLRNPWLKKKFRFQIVYSSSRSDSWPVVTGARSAHKKKCCTFFCNMLQHQDFLWRLAELDLHRKPYKTHLHPSLLYEYDRYDSQRKRIKTSDLNRILSILSFIRSAVNYERARRYGYRTGDFKPRSSQKTGEPHFFQRLHFFPMGSHHRKFEY